MKQLYWRQAGVSRGALVAVALVSVAVLVAVESLPLVVRQQRHEDKTAAARLARDCMTAIAAQKRALGHVSAPEIDPAGTGLIGERLTPVTSNTGVLAAKQTSANPNFAAVVVQWLTEAGIARGDSVAVGVSGSFPGLNVATYAALQVLGVRPVVVVSAASSEWGANHVDYLWLDMERTLREAGLLSIGAVAATYGGIDDRGIGLSEDGRAMIDAAMVRNGITKIDVASLTDSIDKRMALYDAAGADGAAAGAIKAYLNVGGGAASVGTHVGKKQFAVGLNSGPPRAEGVPDSVMLRFAERGIPVIHLFNVRPLAARYGMAHAPRAAVPIGQGTAFVARQYNRWLALGGLLLIVTAMVALLRWNLGTRTLRREGGPKPPALPEPPV